MMALHRSLTRHWRLLPPLALCFALGGVIYAEAPAPAGMTASVALPPPEPRHAVPTIDRTAPAFALPLLASLAEVVKRPLFAATRRPPRLSAAAPGEAPSGLALVGVVRSNGAARALIEHGQPARLAHAAEGDDLDGWTVQSIALDRVVLERAGLRAELRMKDAPSSKTGKPADSQAVVVVIRPPDDVAAEHAAGVQAYMDDHGGMLPPEAQ